MFITPENLNTINLEFTDYCNAACPMCARFKWDGTLYNEKVNQNHNRLEILKKHIPSKIIRQLKRFYSVGTYGEPTINPEFIEILKWVRDLNPDCRLDMDSNGGSRSESFWIQCAKLGISVNFAIDGLEDTNHLYRRNIEWQKLMSNVKAFIGAGGKAIWKMLVFKHNQHQIDLAKKLSIEMGFSRFGWQYSNRWRSSNWITGETQDITRWPAGDYYIEKPTISENNSTDKQYNTVGVYEDKKFNYDNTIRCKMASAGNYEIYIRANGNVQPCCMLGDLDVHESKNLIDDFKSVNINYTNLLDILNGTYFKKLDRGINQGTSERLKNCFYTCGVK